MKDINNYELGVAKGYLAAKQGLEEVKFLSQEKDDDIKEGIREGFKRFLKEKVGDSRKNLKKLHSEFKRIGDSISYFNFLEALHFVRDAEDDTEERLELIEKDGNIQLAERYSAAELDKAKMAIDEDPELDIIEQDPETQDVFIGRKNRCC